MEGISFKDTAIINYIYCKHLNCADTTRERSQRMDADRANRMLKTTIKCIVLDQHVVVIGRSRDRTLEDLASGKLSVLVPTDVAAREIKFTGVETVINVELPEQDAYERYIDRIGCCWRAGNTGHAISYFDPDSPKDVQNAEEYVEEGFVELLCRSSHGFVLLLDSEDDGPRGARLFARICAGTAEITFALRLKQGNHGTKR